MNQKKICFIFNYAPHYREAIYQKIHENLNCDIYLGDIHKNTIKPIANSQFLENSTFLKTIKIYKNLNWIKKSVPLVFRREYKIFIITGEPFCLSSWFILLFNQILGKKTFLWSHGWYGNENGLKFLIKKIYFKLSSGSLLYGHRAKNIMIKNGFDKNSIHVIYNSLNYNFQKKIRESLKPSNIYHDLFNNRYPTVIFTGRLTEVKKLDILLKAQRLLKDKGFIFNIMIIGDGEEREYLESLVSDFDTGSNVNFFGACYQEVALGEYYYNASICVSPGNLGLTGIHSMSYGCPVITHNNFCNQMPEFEIIREGITGDFFVEDDYESLAYKLKDWLFNKELDFDIKEECFKIIDEKYNPNFQISLLKALENNIL